MCVAKYLSNAVSVALIGGEKAVGAMRLNGLFKQFYVDEGKNINSFPRISDVLKVRNNGTVGDEISFNCFTGGVQNRPKPLLTVSHSYLQRNRQGKTS